MKMRVLEEFLSPVTGGIVNASENIVALNYIQIHFMENEVIWLTREKGNLSFYLADE